MTGREEAWELELWARGLRREWWRTAKPLTSRAISGLARRTLIAPIDWVRSTRGRALPSRPEPGPASGSSAPAMPWANAPSPVVPAAAAPVPLALDR